MKSSLVSLLISVAFFAISICAASTSFAQSGGSAQASATIVTPVTVAKLTDLEFSNVPVDAAAARATAKQARMAARARSASTVAAGSVTAASFTVSGYANYVYGVTMPEQVTKAVGNRTVTIGTSLSSSSDSYTLSAHGTGALSIQGTISMGSAESALMASLTGATASTDLNDQNFQAFEEFPVTIIYN